jgi:hypothetical protein
MAIKLADTLAPMADFPAAMAEHVEFADGENLQQKLDDGSLGGGGGEKKGEFLTKEEYDQLEADGLLQEDKNYYILGEAGGEAGASTAFVVTCDLTTDTDEMGVLNVSETFESIHQACVDGRTVELRAYVDRESNAYYSLVPSTVMNEQIVFSVCMSTGGASTAGVTIYISSENYCGVTFSEIDIENVGGAETFVVTCEYEVDDENNWIIYIYFTINISFLLSFKC